MGNQTGRCEVLVVPALEEFNEGFAELFGVHRSFQAIETSASGPRNINVRNLPKAAAAADLLPGFAGPAVGPLNPLDHGLGPRTVTVTPPIDRWGDLGKRATLGWGEPPVEQGLVGCGLIAHRPVIVGPQLTLHRGRFFAQGTAGGLEG